MSVERKSGKTNEQIKLPDVFLEDVATVQGFSDAQYQSFI